MYTPFYENILFPHIQFKYIYPVIQLVQVNFEKHPNTISKNTSFRLVRNLTYGALSDSRRLRCTADCGNDKAAVFLLPS